MLSNNGRQRNVNRDRSLRRQATISMIEPGQTCGTRLSLFSSPSFVIYLYVCGSVLFTFVSLSVC